MSTSTETLLILLSRLLYLAHPLLPGIYNTGDSVHKDYGVGFGYINIAREKRDAILPKLVTIGHLIIKYYVTT